MSREELKKLLLRYALSDDESDGNSGTRARVDASATNDDAHSRDSEPTGSHTRDKSSSSEEDERVSYRQAGSNSRESRLPQRKKRKPAVDYRRMPLGLREISKTFMGNLRRVKYAQPLIKRPDFPVDLNRIDDKLNNCLYVTEEECVDDFRTLIFSCRDTEDPDLIISINQAEKYLLQRLPAHLSELLATQIERRTEIERKSLTFFLQNLQLKHCL